MIKWNVQLAGKNLFKTILKTGHFERSSSRTFLQLNGNGSKEFLEHIFLSWEPYSLKSSYLYVNISSIRMSIIC